MDGYGDLFDERQAGLGEFERETRLIDSLVETWAHFLVDANGAADDYFG